MSTFTQKILLKKILQKITLPKNCIRNIASRVLLQEHCKKSIALNNMASKALH